MRRHGAVGGAERGELASQRGGVVPGGVELALGLARLQPRRVRARLHLAQCRATRRLLFC